MTGGVSVTIGALYTGWRLLSENKLNRSLKASVGDLCALVDLSAISPLWWNNLAFIERSLNDHWEIYKIVECSLRFCWALLRVCWAFIECSLSIHWEIVLDWVKTLTRPWRSLDEHWQIIDRSWRPQGTPWKIVERSGHFFHRSTISQRLLPLCKRGLWNNKWKTGGERDKTKRRSSEVIDLRLITLK